MNYQADSTNDLIVGLTSFLLLRHLQSNFTWEISPSKPAEKHCKESLKSLEMSTTATFQPMLIREDLADLDL